MLRSLKLWVNAIRKASVVSLILVMLTVSSCRNSNTTRTRRSSSEFEKSVETKELETTETSEKIEHSYIEPSFDTKGFCVATEIHMMKNMLFIPNYFGSVYGVGNLYEEAIDDFSKYKYAEAEKKLLTVEKAIEESDYHYYPDDIAFVKEALGVMYLDVADYKKAYDYLIDAYVTIESIYKDRANNTESDLYIQKSIKIALCHYYYDVGDYDSCLVELQKLKESEPETSPQDQNLIVSHYFVMYMIRDIEADILLDRGYRNDAYNLYCKNLEIIKENDSINALMSLFLCIKMGNWCSQSSIESYREQADDFYDLALRKVERYGGEFKGKSKANILMLKGHFLLNYPENEELAWNTIEEAYAIQQELERQRGISYSDIEFYRLYAEAYGFVKQDKEKALTYYNKALETAISIYGENHPETAKVYESLGRYYANRTDDIDKAIEYFDKGIEICRNLLIEKSLIVAKCYLQLAGCYKMKGDSDLSNQYLDKANNMFESLGLKVLYR